ncbi:hypothetical protein [Psychromonas sp. KJ10-2]|uniref:hypothetical protein n=1 Tax=Psychromonas sp. KJ10-2 TaxID=3391822 RepID=UPI0039B51AF5
MNNSNTYESFAAIGAAFMLLGACSEGPAEKTGKKVDSAVTDVTNSIEDTCEDVKDSLNTEDKDC